MNIKKEQNMQQYKKAIYDYSRSEYKLIKKEASGYLARPFLSPGAIYNDDLWDWDSWLTDIAIAQITDEDIFPYQQGCILGQV